MKISIARLKEIVMEEVARAATTEAAVPDPEWGGHTYTNQASNPNALDNPKPSIDCKKFAVRVKELRANVGDSGFGKALLKNKEDQFKKMCAGTALEETIEIVDDE